jgi:predicted transcriptional regulator
MRILLSIRPEFAFKIFEGSKFYEFRRTIFRRNDVKKVIVYVSSPIQKVIGEFEIDFVISDNPKILWKLTKEHAGIDKEDFFNYFADTDKGYAIKIKNCKKYDFPLLLKESFGVYPPQSFVYVK